MKRRTLTRVWQWALALVILALYVFPFGYLVLTSLKPPIDVIAVPPRILPVTWTLENYVVALVRPGVIASFINSISTAVISTVFSVALAVPAAWGIVRYGGRTAGAFIVGTLATRMVPPIAIGVPLMAMMRTLQLSDTPTGTAIAHVTISLPLSILLMCSFFDAVPGQLDEAAQVDGCSRLGALWHVILPVASGGMAVTAIFAFLASWNEFLFSLLLTSVRAQTTPIMISQFQTQFGLQWGPMTALAVVYSLPVVIVTIFLQRHIVTGLTLGAVKG